MKNEPHVHMEMICAKAKNMNLVKLVKGHDGVWRKSIKQGTNFLEHKDYYLCHEKHLEACLHWLNNGKSGVDFELNDVEDWHVIKEVFRNPEWDITIKPTTITINGVEVPEPCREPPEFNQTCYIPSFKWGDHYDVHVWKNTNGDNNLLKNGMIHLGYAAAVLHAEAMSSFTTLRKEK